MSTVDRNQYRAWSVGEAGESRVEYEIRSVNRICFVQPTTTTQAGDTHLPAPSDNDRRQSLSVEITTSPIRNRQDKGKGKQRESQQPQSTSDDEQVDRKQQAVKDIDLLIERVKLDQAASEIEYRAARGDRGGKEPMV